MVGSLSSLTGLKRIRATIIPALKCWAIIACPCRDKIKTAPFECRRLSNNVHEHLLQKARDVIAAPSRRRFRVGRFRRNRQRASNARTSCAAGRRRRPVCWLRTSLSCGGGFGETVLEFDSGFVALMISVEPHCRLRRSRPTWADVADVRLGFAEQEQVCLN